MSATLPAVGFIGPSGVGKTTLVVRLLARLRDDGLRLGAVKHDAHEFQMDREGKDTWRFAHAGAAAVAIASSRRRATLVETERPTSLAELLATLPGDLDGALVEGYRAGDVPKLVVHRRGFPLAAAPGVVAVVSDDPDVPGRVPLDDFDAIVALVRRLLRHRAAHMRLA